MGDVRARICLPAGGNTGQAITVSVDPGQDVSATNVLPCKEWSITDDVLNLSDSASFTVSNIDGENNKRFAPGQRVVIDLADDDVAGGDWIRSFTGIVTSIERRSDDSSGSTILISAMDLGWMLTSCHGKPLTQIKSKRFSDLLSLLIDPSWGFQGVVASNDLNRRLKHGRQVIVQNFQPREGAVLPYIQVEPGQSPFDLIQTYAAREGVLVNVSAKGELVFFQPHYDDQALYRAEYHKSTDPDAEHNNLVGTPTLRETIDGLYSEVQCWSTAVLPLKATGQQDAENPNEAFRHTTFTPSTNPLPFSRRHVFSDSEAITDTLRTNRATWKQQMGQFQSWTYEVEIEGHSQGGAFFVSDTMITVIDTVNDIRGVYYVQSVRRSQTLSGGTRSKLTIRKPGLLNPQLAALPDKKIGGGAKRAAKPQPVIP